MIEFAFVNKLLIFLIDVIGLALGIMVFLNNPKQKINKIFVLMVVLMLMWVNFAYFARIFQDSIFLRVAWFVTPLFFSFLYFLVIYLLNKEREYRFLNITVLLAGGIAALVTGFTNLIVAGIKFSNGDLTIIYGRGMFPFLGVIFFLVCATIYPLIREYIKASAEKRARLGYFLVGIFIFYLANVIFNITFPVFFGIVRFYYLGDYSTIFLLGFIAYAIVAKELFGIKVILTQFLVGAIAVLLLWQVVVATGLVDFTWKLALLILFLVFGYFLIRSVIQEIKRRAELQRLYEEVDKLSKTKSEFLSIASHQLRTPLTAIKGYISMIIEGTYGKLGPKVLKPLGNVYQSNERLIKLVNDLLNLSRLEAGKIEFVPELISLEEMVSSIAEELRINAKKKGLYVKLIKPSSPLPKVMADQDKLRQVVLNIIDNGIKYTRKGGLTIELRKAGSQAEVQITDTGEGMAKEEIRSLFQMFSRASAGAQLHTEGAGVGLYVAKQFIEMHKGRIWAESQGKGKGSKFIIQLPINS